MKQKHFGTERTLLTVCVVLVLLAVVFAATGVFASLGDTTGVVTVKNGALHCEVDKDYGVRNTGNIPALLRAKVVINWIDGEGSVLAEAPEGAVLTIGEISGWTQFPADPEKPEGIDDGYWYYNGIAEPDAVCAFLGTVKAEGGTARVTVLAEALQATPAEAAAEAWGMAFSDGSWRSLR